MRRFVALVVLLAGIILSPLRAVAATIPALIAYDAAVRPTATTRIVSEPSPQPEPRSANEYGYDGALVRYDGPSNPPVAAGTGAVHAYDGTLELTERREVAEGVIYDATVATVAAEAVAPSSRALGAALQTSIQRFPSSQRIMRIKKVAFRAPLVRGVDIFRLPHRMSATYLSRRFIDAANAAGLIGLDFRLIWSEPS
jgi:hypothetical protein